MFWGPTERADRSRHTVYVGFAKMLKCYARNTTSEVLLTEVKDIAICSLEVDSRTRLEASFKGLLPWYFGIFMGWAPKLPRFA